MRDDELLEQLRAGVRHLGENPRELWEKLIREKVIDLKGTVQSPMNILDGLPYWSDRNLRWLIDYLARLKNHSVQATYTVIQKKACALRDERESTGQEVADKYETEGRFMLAGVEGHDFGRCKTSTECYELAARMGLGILPSLDASGYFGHAIVQEVESNN
jgi:hypothetical protein